MADHPRYPDEDDPRGRPHHESTGTPWGTYAFAVIAIVLVLGFVLLHLTGTLGPGAH